MDGPFGVPTGGLGPTTHGLGNQELMGKDGVLLERLHQCDEMLLASRRRVVGLDEAGLVQTAFEDGVLAGEFLVGLFGIDEGEIADELLADRVVRFHGFLSDSCF